MLYVIVNLPARTPFNPFISSRLFDVFCQTNKQSKQELNSYITYETNSKKVDEYIRNGSTKPARFLVLQMQVQHRYEIPQQYMEFMRAVHQADFYMGAFHKTIALPPIAKPIASVPLKPKQPEKFVNNIRYPYGLQTTPQIRRMFHLDSKSQDSRQLTPAKDTKPVAFKAPRQVPPGVQVRPPYQAPPRQVAPQHEPQEVIPMNLPEIPRAALPIQPVGPLSQVPYPQADLKETARKDAEKLGEDLPMECTDPITLEPLTDPIEINRRVYNRETLEDMIKEGAFNDPFTRELINPTTAKPAHYMLQAISQHAAATKGEEPSLLATHKDTQCIPLQNLLEQWGQMLKVPSHSL